MSGLVNVLVIVAVIAVVVVRQCSARRISDGKRCWILPGVLLVVSLREHGLVDPRHEALSVAVLGAELAVGLVAGAAGAGLRSCGARRTVRCGPREPKQPSLSGQGDWRCVRLFSGLPR